MNGASSLYLDKCQNVGGSRDFVEREAGGPTGSCQGQCVPFPRAPLSCGPGSHFLWSWIPLNSMYFSLVPVLLSFIPNHFSPSPPTPSRSRPPKPAVQSSVSTLPCPVHRVHQLLLSPFLQCSLSKVPGDLWFLNLVDSSCRHSFHKYLLRPHCVLSTLPATWDPSEKIILRPLPLCSPRAGPRLTGPPRSALPLAAWGEGGGTLLLFSLLSPPIPRPWAAALFSLGLMTPPSTPLPG